MSETTVEIIAFSDRRVFGTILGKAAHALLALLLACVVCFPSQVAAQETQDAGRSPAATITKQVLTDPTTYLPAGLLYTSMQLDWNSSQPFFANGFVENNAKYTRSGLPRDLPISYGAGNRKLIMESVAVIPSSLANNAINRVIQRSLNERFPNKRKLWTVLAFVERAAFASYASYLVSTPHFEQWRMNERLAKELGY
jgi:hypothetical protein